MPAEIGKENGAGHKNYRTPLAVGSVVIVVICAVTAYIMLAGGIQDRSQWVIALFTIVMTVSTTLQWMEMAKQNGVMIAQNKAIEHQIEEARLERRAWLAIEKVVIPPLRDGERVRCRIWISNTGVTPGRITAGHVRCCQNTPTVNPTDFVPGFESQGLSTAHEYVIPPGKVTSIFIKDLDQIHEHGIKMIGDGTMELHILARFSYVDISSERHEIKGIFTAIGLTGGTDVRGSYSSMD